MKNLALPLAIVGFFAIASMALVLALIDQDMRISTLEYQSELAQLDHLVGPRESIRAAYDEYHALVPERVDVYVQTFQSGELSPWLEGKNHPYVVRELRLSYFEGKVRFATLSEIAPSGDWSQDANYYFRADGTIAMVVGDLNTFHGDVMVHKVRLYGPDGDPIERRVEILDIETGLPVEREYDHIPLIEFRSVAEMLAELQSHTQLMS